MGDDLCSWMRQVERRREARELADFAQSAVCADADSLELEILLTSNEFAENDARNRINHELWRDSEQHASNLQDHEVHSHHHLGGRPCEMDGWALERPWGGVLPLGNPVVRRVFASERECVPQEDDEGGEESMMAESVRWRSTKKRLGRRKTSQTRRRVDVKEEELERRISQAL